jgi:hypothetical protein
VSHCALAIYMKKVSEGKQRIMETQIFQYAKIWSSKNLLKRNQNPSRYYYNSVTNLKFPTQAKIPSFKNPHIKIDLL